MSDNIEVFEDGTAAFASFREPGWHALGTVFHDELSTRDMLIAARMNDWNVRFVDFIIPEGMRMVDNRYLVVRTNPSDYGTDILGVVGERYNILQNEELFSFGDAMLDGGRWETAGSLKSGKVVFGSLALERSTVIDPSGVADRVDNYLLLSSSHDGTASIQASVTPVRVVCANTLAIALRGAKQTFKIRHTQTMQGKIQAAREALGLTHKYLDAWDEAMQALIQKSVDDNAFLDLIGRVYEPNDTKAGVTRFEKRKDVIWDFWTAQENEAIRGTGWGAYNALNEELMWGRNGRGANADENVAASRSGFNPVWNAANQDLFAAVQAL
jgi:phage/plasmid-like protein (TIGR03299 family)